MSEKLDPSTRPVTVPDVVSWKGRRKIAALTAYDAPTAFLLDRAGLDVLLVGDSLEMAVYGERDTLGATLDRMVAHARAVSGAAARALVVGDMPWMSYHTTPDEAVRNAARFVREGGCKAVKLEGGAVRLPMVRALLDAEIPVMGHVGLTPQSVNALGGYKVQGKTEDAADRILHDAAALADAGVFAIVLECVPADLAARITRDVSVPTIGIGAGAACDGQILVLHDMIGLKAPGAPSPKFVRRYADVGAVIGDAVTRYVADVKSGAFPTAEESYGEAARDAGTVVRLYG